MVTHMRGAPLHLHKCVTRFVGDNRVSCYVGGLRTVVGAE